MKIAVLGAGVEGASAVKYFKNHPELSPDIKIFDEKHGDDFSKIDFADFDLVFKSPSIRPDRIKCQKEQLSSVTEYFFEHCPAPIIGVTGTKGKGTTCSLIASILAAAKFRVHLVGNIGKSALDALDQIQPQDWVIYELSSFQLWHLGRSPHIAVVVHIEPDHLDVHNGFEEYLDAKSNITRYQKKSDLVIYDRNNPYSSRIAKLSPGKKQAYPTQKYEKLLDSLAIPGSHNRQNGEAAILAARAAGVSDDAVIMAGLSNFHGLPHRLKFVREWQGVQFYDDSISTTPGSTIAAIRSFPNSQILILGGSSKGADFSELAAAIKDSPIKKVVAVGASADVIEKTLLNVGYRHIINLGLDTTMSKIVKVAVDYAEPNDIILLSPACASFDLFKSYSDRGDQFIAAVQDLWPTTFYRLHSV